VGVLTCPALQLAEKEGIEHPVALHVTGRLNLPVPLAQPIHVHARREQDRYRVELHNGTSAFLTGSVTVADQPAEPGSILQSPPIEKMADLEDLVELADADLQGPTLGAQYFQKLREAGIEREPPVCFGCGQTETALKLRMRVAKPGYIWTRWETEPGFTDGGGRLAATIVAAALDCSTVWVIYTNEPDMGLELELQRKGWISGTYGVHFLRVPPMEVEGGYRVATRYLGRDRRKSFTMSALLDRKGTVYAIGEAVAVQIDWPEGWNP